jgi:hypothetical protein
MQDRGGGVVQFWQIAGILFLFCPTAWGFHLLADLVSMPTNAGQQRSTGGVVGTHHTKTPGSQPPTQHTGHQAAKFWTICLARARG